jgi:hypothetical protein
MDRNDAFCGRLRAYNGVARSDDPVELQLKLRGVIPLVPRATLVVPNVVNVTYEDVPAHFEKS